MLTRNEKRDRVVASRLLRASSMGAISDARIISIMSHLFKVNDNFGNGWDRISIELEGNRNLPPGRLSAQLANQHNTPERSCDMHQVKGRLYYSLQSIINHTNNTPFIALRPCLAGC